MTRSRVVRGFECELMNVFEFVDFHVQKRGMNKDAARELFQVEFQNAPPDMKDMKGPAGNEGRVAVKAKDIIHCLNMVDEEKRVERGNRDVRMPTQQKADVLFNELAANPAYFNHSHFAGLGISGLGHLVGKDSLRGDFRGPATPSAWNPDLLQLTQSSADSRSDAGSCCEGPFDPSAQLPGDENPPPKRARLDISSLMNRSHDQRVMRVKQLQASLQGMISSTAAALQEHDKSPFKDDVSAVFLQSLQIRRSTVEAVLNNKVNIHSDGKSTEISLAGFLQSHVASLPTPPFEGVDQLRPIAEVQADINSIHRQKSPEELDACLKKIDKDLDIVKACNECLRKAVNDLKNARSKRESQAKAAEASPASMFSTCCLALLPEVCVASVDECYFGAWQAKNAKQAQIEAEKAKEKDAAVKHLPTPPCKEATGSPGQQLARALRELPLYNIRPSDSAACVAAGMYKSLEELKAAISKGDVQMYSPYVLESHDVMAKLVTQSGKASLLHVAYCISVPT